MADRIIKLDMSELFSHDDDVIVEGDLDALEERGEIVEEKEIDTVLRHASPIHPGTGTDQDVHGNWAHGGGSAGKGGRSKQIGKEPLPKGGPDSEEAQIDQSPYKEPATNKAAEEVGEVAALQELWENEDEDLITTLEDTILPLLEKHGDYRMGATAGNVMTTLAHYIELAADHTESEGWIEDGWIAEGLREKTLAAFGDFDRFFSKALEQSGAREALNSSEKAKLKKIYDFIDANRDAIEEAERADIELEINNAFGLWESERQSLSPEKLAAREGEKDVFMAYRSGLPDYAQNSVYVNDLLIETLSDGIFPAPNLAPSTDPSYSFLSRTSLSQAVRENEDFGYLPDEITTTLHSTYAERAKSAETGEFYEFLATRGDTQPYFNLESMMLAGHTVADAKGYGWHGRSGFWIPPMEGDLAETADWINQGWATLSATPASYLLNKIVAEKFGGTPEPLSVYDPEGGMPEDIAKPELIDDPKTIRETEEFVDRMYERTQKWLADRGLGPGDTVRMYRGMGTLANDSWNPEGKEGDVEVSMYAVSSWTTDPKIAEMFGRAGTEWGEEKKGAVVVADIPVDRLLANSDTGIPARLEEEWLVAGGPIEAKVYSVKRSPAYWRHGLPVDRDIDENQLRELSLELYRQAIDQIGDEIGPEDNHIEYDIDAILGQQTTFKAKSAVSLTGAFSVPANSEITVTVPEKDVIGSFNIDEQTRDWIGQQLDDYGLNRAELENPTNDETKKARKRYLGYKDSLRMKEMKETLFPEENTERDLFQQRHYGPGPHPGTGTPQTVHGSGAPSASVSGEVMPSAKAEEFKGTLYHGTHRKHLESISQYGLLPGRGPMVQWAYGEYMGEEYNNPQTGESMVPELIYFTGPRTGEMAMSDESAMAKAFKYVKDAIAFDKYEGDESKVTWADVREHGLLVTVGEDDFPVNDLYMVGTEQDFYEVYFDWDTETVEYSKTPYLPDEYATGPETGDYFSPESISATQVIYGDELVRLGKALETDYPEAFLAGQMVLPFEFKTFLLRHYGPGAHPGTGTPQTVHAPDGAGGGVSPSSESAGSAASSKFDGFKVDLPMEDEIRAWFEKHHTPLDLIDHYARADSHTYKVAFNEEMYARWEEMRKQRIDAALAELDEMDLTQINPQEFLESEKKNELMDALAGLRDQLEEEGRKEDADYVFNIWSEMMSSDREREDAMQFAIRRAVARGEMTVDEAMEIDAYDYGKFHGSIPWNPLPDTLYHTTVAATPVRAEGLKSRFELGGGQGLGGGDSTTISYTASRDWAEWIERAIQEAHLVATGEVTAEDLIKLAAKGADNQGDGFLTKMMSYSGMYFTAFKNDTEINETVRRYFNNPDFDPTAPIPEDVIRDERQRRRAQDWLDLYIDDDTIRTDLAKKITGDRYFPDPDELAEAMTQVTDEDLQREKRERAFQLFKIPYAAARQEAGGPQNPLIWGGSHEDFAKIDPNEIRTFVFKPKEGAMGGRLGALDEWRTYGGDNVEMVDELNLFEPEDLFTERTFLRRVLRALGVRHYGPGPHPGTGTPQTVHGSGGAALSVQPINVRDIDRMLTWGIHEGKLYVDWTADLDPDDELHGHYILNLKEGLGNKNIWSSKGVGGWVNGKPMLAFHGQPDAYDYEKKQKFIRAAAELAEWAGMDEVNLYYSPNTTHFYKLEPQLETRGGPGSGHFGHKGRPDKVGGSLPEGGYATRPGKPGVEVYGSGVFTPMLKDVIYSWQGEPGWGIAQLIYNKVANGQGNVEGLAIGQDGILQAIGALKYNVAPPSGAPAEDQWIMLDGLYSHDPAYSDEAMVQVAAEAAKHNAGLFMKLGSHSGPLAAQMGMKLFSNDEYAYWTAEQVQNIAKTFETPEQVDYFAPPTKPRVLMSFSDFYEEIMPENPSTNRPPPPPVAEMDMQERYRWENFNYSHWATPERWEPEGFAREVAGMGEDEPTNMYEARAIENLQALHDGWQDGTDNMASVLFSEGVAEEFGGTPIPKERVRYGYMSPRHLLADLVLSYEDPYPTFAPTEEEFFKLPEEQQWDWLTNYKAFAEGTREEDLAVDYSKVAREIYDRTQAMFKEAGFEPGDTVRLYRGLRANPEDRLDGADGGWVRLDQWAISSWSSAKSIAGNFATMGGGSGTEEGEGTLFTADVPVERILSNWQTGPGSHGEFEYLVLGQEGIQAYATKVTLKPGTENVEDQKIANAINEGELEAGDAEANAYQVGPEIE